MIASLEQTASSLPSYFNDLNKDSKFKGGDYSYLIGLPVRPTKRRRFTPRDQSCGCSTADASCLPPYLNNVSLHHYLNNAILHAPIDSFWRKGSVVMSTVVVIIGAYAMLRRQKRDISCAGSVNTLPEAWRSENRENINDDASIIVDSDTGCIEVVHRSSHDSVTSPSKDIQNLSSELICESSNVVDVASERSNYVFSPDDKSSDESPQDDDVLRHDYKDSVLLSAGYHDTSNDTILSLKAARAVNGQLTNIHIEQLAQRWESKGLDRQRSLELAAHFEMNMLFFRELQHFLYLSACNCMNRLVWMHSVSLDQINQNHQERMNAPHLEAISRCRHQMKFVLLNTRVLIKCVLAAVTSKYISIHGNIPMLWSKITSFDITFGALSAIYSAICSECSIGANGPIETSSYYYGFDYLGNYLYQGADFLSCAFLCFVKILWYASILIFCDRYISRGLSCAIISMFFLNWQSLLKLGMAIVATNFLLTLFLFKLTSAKSSKLEVHEVTEYYMQCIQLSELFSPFPSILLGVYLGIHGTCNLK